jgi:hypothetical protein
MHGEINILFGTYQTDLFDSGLVAEIGVPAFAVWCAIKGHSDFKTGRCWPSIRRLMTLTGLASATVQGALTRLEKNHLLRSTVKGQRRYYVPRERLDVKLGKQTLCIIVVDYVPNVLRDRLNAIKETLETGKNNPTAFVDVEIIPGLGFIWDSTAGVLRAAVPINSILPLPDPLSDEELSPLALQARQISMRAKFRKT